MFYLFSLRKCFVVAGLVGTVKYCASLLINVNLRSFIHEYLGDDLNSINTIYVFRESRISYYQYRCSYRCGMKSGFCG